MRRALHWSVAVLTVGGLAGVGHGAKAVTSTPAGCAEPEAAWSAADPAAVAMDPVKLQDALDWATLHTSFSVSVVRHGCLVGQSRLDAATATEAYDGWSMTKSVTSMLVGRAVTLGLFDIDAPLGDLFPEADAAHASLTARHLLTMTSGLHVNWVRDLSPMPDRIRDALSLAPEFAPGEEWQYCQSTVTWLANALERAVGRDLQAFAQDELFGPLGIEAGTWKWERDRAGHTEGWAHLHMRSGDFARLGLLMLRSGLWSGEQLISADYVGQALTSTPANDAYGLLFWLNDGDSYVLPDVEGSDEGNGPLIASAPRDTFLMAGSGEQRTYVIPSRDLVIVRLGERGSREGDTRASVWTGRAGELDNELVRRILLAVDDVPYDDPGPYAGSEVYLPPPDAGIIGDAQDVERAGAGVGVGPHAPAGCTPFGCE